LLAEIKHPVVMETHGGWGAVWRRCYAHLPDGVVFEKKPEKAETLARQRPTWAVYECDCVFAIREGVGNHLPVNFVDLDPYGEPWPVMDALFQSDRKWPRKLAIAVNDGLRQKLRINGGWDVASLTEKVAEYGSASVHDHYLQICQELVQEKAGQVGYTLTRWAGYHCGSGEQMTHYAAILEK
jgi:hypothetical protein